MKPVTFDGWIYALIAFFGAAAAAFASDEAAKYIIPVVLFYAKTGCQAISATLLAVKMYRSTAYADYQTEKKNGNGHKPDEIKTAVSSIPPAP